MKNEILVPGLEIVVISKGPYKDLKGKIIKIIKGKESTADAYKVRFDTMHGPGSKSTFYRWLHEEDIIPSNDPAYGLIFG